MKTEYSRIINLYPKATLDKDRKEITLHKKDDYAYVIAKHTGLKRKVLGYTLMLRIFDYVEWKGQKAKVMADTALMEYNKFSSVKQTIKSLDLTTTNMDTMLNTDLFNPERLQ